MPRERLQPSRGQPSPRLTGTIKRLEDTARRISESNVRSGAFSGYNHGGDSRSFSSRGSQSFGGGGGSRGGGFGGGGGSHGGGGPRGR